MGIAISTIGLIMLFGGIIYLMIIKSEVSLWNITRKASLDLAKKTSLSVDEAKKTMGYDKYKRTPLKYTLAWICICFGIPVIILGILFQPSASKYDREKAKQTKIEQEQEDQWIQDNFGNGKGKAIQQAIDDYKNN